MNEKCWKVFNCINSLMVSKKKNESLPEKTHDMSSASWTMSDYFTTFIRMAEQMRNYLPLLSSIAANQLSYFC